MIEHKNSDCSMLSIILWPCLKRFRAVLISNVTDQWETNQKFDEVKKLEPGLMYIDKLEYWFLIGKKGPLNVFVDLFQKSSCIMFAKMQSLLNFSEALK